MPGRAGPLIAAPAYLDQFVGELWAGHDCEPGRWMILVAGLVFADSFGRRFVITERPGKAAAFSVLNLTAGAGRILLRIRRSIQISRGDSALQRPMLETRCRSPPSPTGEHRLARES